MPQAYTHIRIARQVSERLKESMGAPDCTAAYEMGAHGPDPLFAYAFWKKKRALDLPALADVMHRQQCGAFLRALVFRAYTVAQRSYVMGFLTHYAADTTMHPYVLSQTQQGQAFAQPYGHEVMETALDVWLCDKDTGGRVGPECTVSNLHTAELAEVMALLKACIQQVYHEAVHEEALADSLHDFTWLHQHVFHERKRKSRLLCMMAWLTGDKAGRAAAYMTALSKPPEEFARQWVDAGTGQLHEGGPLELCDKAVQEAVRMIKMATAYWLGVASPEQLAVALGDLNYLTGGLSDVPMMQESVGAMLAQSAPADMQAVPQVYTLEQQLADLPVPKAQQTQLGADMTEAEMQEENVCR